MKKLFKVVPAFVLAATALASCGPKEPAESEQSLDLTGTYDVTLWVSESEGVKELTQEQITKFEAANPGIVINETVEGVSEADSATQMITDVEGGADIFCFAQDQLGRLVEVGALNKLGAAATKTVTELNDAGAVNAAKVAGNLYCYPMTSDNGYFMYYDKSVVKAEHVDSLEDIIADCKAAGKNFSMEVETSGWYNVAWFFATGCHSTWTTDTAGKFTSVDDNFNSDNGVIALKGMQKLLKSGIHVSSSKASDFNAPVPSAVVVTGTWDAKVAQEALKENFAAAKLPKFTVDGKSYQLGSFSGNKLMGCKPSTDAKKNAVLSKLALFLTNEQSQLERFDLKGWGPSNLAAQQSEKVKKDLALSALAAQAPYSIPQGQIHGSWWDISKVYCTAAKSAKTDQELKDALAAYKAAIDGLFSMSDEERNAFTVIGNIKDTNWDTDFEMVESPKGTWTSKDVFALKANQEFKCRQGKSWDVAFGKDGNNYVVEADGNYKIQLVVDAAGNGTITLIAQ